MGLSRLRQAIDTEDSQTLLGIFTRARIAREYFSTLLTGTAYELSSTPPSVETPNLGVDKPGE